MPRHPPPLHLALNTTSIYVVNETTPNAADLVYARVKQRILQGDLEGGRMLSEAQTLMFQQPLLAVDISIDGLPAAEEAPRRRRASPSRRSSSNLNASRANHPSSWW